MNDVDVFEVAMILVFNIVENQADLVTSVGDDFTLEEVAVAVEDHFKLGVFLALEGYCDLA